MNKSDYDKYYKKGGTYVIPVEVFNELFDELERLSFNYEQALEDLDKKDNIINELEKWLVDYIKLFDESDMLEEQTCEDLKEVLDKLQELKGDGSNEYKLFN